MNKGIKPLWKSRLGQTIAFSLDSKLLAVGGAHGTVRLLNAQNGDYVLSCEGPKNDIYRIAFSHDGNTMAIGQFNRLVAFCDYKTGKITDNLKFDESEIFDLEFNQKTGHLLRTSRDSKLQVFATSPPRIYKSIKPTPEPHTVHRAFFSPDGEKLFAVWSTTSGKQEVAVAKLSWPEGKQIATTLLNVELVYNASISADSRFLAFSFSSYTPSQLGIAILDAKTLKTIRTFSHGICAVIFVPSRPLLIASDGEDETEYCYMIEPKTGKELARFEVGNCRIFDFDISADERYLAAATSKGAMVWDLKAIYSILGVP